MKRSETGTATADQPTQWVPTHKMGDNRYYGVTTKANPHGRMKMRV